MRQHPSNRNRLAFLALALLLSACAEPGGDPAAKKRMSPEYDKATGKLTLLKYDSDGNGKDDTFSYMDGARVIRIEIDKDEDGTIDRWEHYDANQKLAKIGTSRAQDGKEDSWAYLAADGTIERIDVSTKHDGKVTRVEHYQKNALVVASILHLCKSDASLLPPMRVHVHPTCGGENMMKELQKILMLAMMLCALAAGVVAQDKKNEKPPPKEKPPVVVVVVKPAPPSNEQKGGDKKGKP